MQYSLSCCAASWNIGCNNLLKNRIKILNWILNVSLLLTQYKFKTVSNIAELSDDIIIINIKNNHVKNKLLNIYNEQYVLPDSKVRIIKEIIYCFIDFEKLTLIVKLDNDITYTFAITNSPESINQYNSDDRLIINMAKIILFIYDNFNESKYLSFVSDYFDDIDYGKSFESIKNGCIKLP